MDSNKFTDLLINNIDSARLASGGKEVVMRCRYCPDSSDPRSAHMYVSVGLNDEPCLYNCFKCHTCGIVDRQTLMDWNIFDSDALIDISDHNKRVLKLSKNKKFIDKEIYTLYNSFVRDHPYSYKKLEYINKRLGTDLSFEDILKLKIVINLFDVINANGINKFTRHEMVMNELDVSFIGFISYDNAFINMRNLREGKTRKPLDKRWIKYSVFDKFNTTLRCYTIPSTVDLLKPERIKINIAEGPFDILSIYLNLRQKEEHSLYAAILGSGYKNLCNYFIRKMGFIYSEVHIYKDADIEWRVFDEIKEMLIVYGIPLYIHENIYPGEKDFGVPLDRIDERVTRLL